MTINRKIAGVWIGDTHPVRVMGVLNLSPESFYKGSVVSKENSAVAKAKQMVAAGAEFLDLGATSTAPGVKPISTEEEMSRLIPVLKAVFEVVDVPISVDTFRAAVADEALKNGAQIINDVSSFKKDSEMVGVLKDHDAPAIIMATNKTIGDPLKIPEIIDCLQSSIAQVESLGYNSDNIIVDPAIGRWVPEKTYQYNMDIIRNLNEISKLERPILVGISRKSFIHEILDRPEPGDRLPGTLGTTAIAVYNGAHIVRTHDVAPTIDVVRLAKMLRDGGCENAKLTKNR